MQIAASDQKVVVFRVGREEFAVTITAVKEVVTWSKPTPVPESPPVVEGVMHLRDQIIPVIDLGKLFRTQRLKADEDSRIIVMEVGGQQAGFVVDDVTEVATLAPSSVSPPSPVLRSTVSSGAGQIISGIARMGDSRLLLVVEASRILSSAQLSA